MKRDSRCDHPCFCQSELSARQSHFLPPPTPSGGRRSAAATDQGAFDSPACNRNRASRPGRILPGVFSNFASRDVKTALPLREQKEKAASVKPKPVCSNGQVPHSPCRFPCDNCSRCGTIGFLQSSSCHYRDSPIPFPLRRAAFGSCPTRVCGQISANQGPTDSGLERTSRTVG